MRALLAGNWHGLLAIGVVIIAGVVTLFTLTPSCQVAKAADPPRQQRTWFSQWKNFLHAQEPQPARVETDTDPAKHSNLKGENTMISLEKTPIGKVEHATTETFGRMVLESKGPVLVDFYADWCGPCQRLAPILDEVASETPHARVIKVNVDDSPELARQFNVSSIPSLMVFKEGRLVDQRLGLSSKAQLKAWVSK